MRSNEERARLVRARTARLTREKRARVQRAGAAGAAALCVALIALFGAWMPGLMMRVDVADAQNGSGTASLLASGATLGYVLMGVTSFSLGVCVTVLLYRLRRESGRQEDADDEL